MIKVPIRSVYNGEFYHTDGYKYKMGSTSNTRIECHRIDAPKVRLQFSSYDTVQVDDQEAKNIYMFLTKVLQGMKSDMNEMERGIKMLEEQGVVVKDTLG